MNKDQMKAVRRELCKVEDETFLPHPYDEDDL